MKKFSLKIRGFSLVELMAVVTIVGVLVALALPRFRTFIARSRMAEAINNLAVIDRLQKSYNLRHMSLGDGKDDVWWTSSSGDIIMGMGGATAQCDPANLKNGLGFRVEDCTKLRYLYKTSGAASDEAENQGNSPQGLAIYPGCGTGVDTWVNHRNTGSSKLEHKDDIIEYCK